MNPNHLLLAAVFLAGCTAAPPVRYTGVEPEVRKTSAVKTIEITSVPVGCIVEVNGEYIGQTPLSLTVDADANGCWPRRHPDGSVRSFSNQFVCTAPNGARDRRYWIAGDRIPEAVVFRPYGRSPAQQPLRLGMNSGS